MTNTEKLETKKMIAAWKKLGSRKMRYNFDVGLFAETVTASYEILKKYKDDDHPPRYTDRLFRAIRRFGKPLWLNGSNEFYAARTISEDLYYSFGEFDMIGDYEGGVTPESIEYAIEGLLESYEYAKEVGSS